MSEPVDLTGMTPEQVRRAVRAAARTMEPLRPPRPKKAKPPVVTIRIQTKKGEGK